MHAPEPSWQRPGEVNILQDIVTGLRMSFDETEFEFVSFVGLLRISAGTDILPRSWMAAACGSIDLID